MKKLLLLCGLTFGTLLALPSCQDSVETVEERVELPEIHVTTDDSSVTIDSAGGTGVLKYEVINPQGVDSVEIFVEDGAGDWIASVELEKFATSGKVVFEAPRNLTNDVRRATVTLKYFYTATDFVAATATVNQTCEIFDYNFTAKSALCRYWGRGIATYDYEVILGDVDCTLGTAGGTYYTINFCDNIETDDRLPGAGGYHFPEESNMSEGKHIYTGYCSYFKIGADGNYADGPLQIWDGKDFFIEREGDIFTIYGDLFDQNGKQHRIYYQGTMELYDATILSDFKEDVKLDLSGMHAEASVVELYGWSNWASIYIVPDTPEEGDPAIRIELYTEADVFTVATGQYLLDDGMCNPGFFNGGHLWDRRYINGTWLFSCENVTPDGMYDFGRPRAPFVDGDIDIRMSEDGKTMDISINVIDSQGNLITGAQDGLPVSYFDNE